MQRTESQNGELFGPDPGIEPLAYYAPPDPAADVFTDATPEIARSWHALASGLAGHCQGRLDELQELVAHQVSDLGVAFRLTGDDQERPWPLSPMPIVIGAEEWDRVEAGLIQRAQLLEAVVADIYGEQSLVRDGHLPSGLVSGSGNFARRLVGARPAGGRYLHVCAMDLVRGPGGEWRVLADRLRLPVGIGYALENRQALSRATGGLLASIGTRRQSAFFESLRQGIAAGCARVEPRIGLLSPGRFNQSYPEQALLARHLGFSLVEGRDLVVHENRLFVRTIAGLKRIDGLWRWIVTRDIDPMNFDARSRIGVPDIASAITEGGLVIANWPGSGVAESRAMSAFIPKLAKVMLEQDLLLPNVATWWCGQDKEREYVEEHLDELVISSAFRERIKGLPDGHSRAGASFTPAERSEILDGLVRRPMDYTAQEIVSLSTTPTLLNGRFEPRGFTLRAFLARDADGNWQALAGGFARISERGDLRTSLMGLGDISADVCIAEHAPPGPLPAATLPESPAIRREQRLLSSQSADNLYWFGRYCERANETCRFVRLLLDSGAGAEVPCVATSTTERLTSLLIGLGAITPKRAKDPIGMVASDALSNEDRPGSAVSVTHMARDVSLLLRDRLTRDSWRVINRPFPHFIPGDIDGMMAACDNIIERFAMLARLTSEGMSRTAAWRFLDMGICLERGSLILQAVQAMMPGSASAEDLSVLLDLVDSQSLYRSRYLTMPMIDPVLDIVLLDPLLPRGLAYQVNRIVAHLEEMPVIGDSGLVEAPLRKARQLKARLEGLDAAALGPGVLGELWISLSEVSDAVAQRYFLQEEGPAANEGAQLLA